MGISLFPSITALLACIGTVFLPIGDHFPRHAFSYDEARPQILHTGGLDTNLHIQRPATSSSPPQQVSITDLLTNSQDYHQQRVAVRGLVTQPELHLDETELYLDFVFRLAQGKHSIVVYGRHDRTRSAPAIIINHTVEVIGIFWKEQDRNGSRIFNTIEAISVTPHPSPIPEKT